MDETSMISLSLELIIHITRFMSAKDILSLSSTCKDYRDIILNTRYDKVLYLKSNIYHMDYYLYKFEKNFKLDINLCCKVVYDASMLGRIYSLDLSWTDVEDVSMLGGVHTLNLSHTNVKDVSMVGGVHTLNLSNTEIEDVSMLGGVHTLDLNGTFVEDVSMLGGVHTLHLSYTRVKESIEEMYIISFII